MTDAAAPRGSAGRLVLAAAALLGPPASTVAAALVGEDVGVRGETMWWLGAWLAALCTGLAVYVLAALRRRAVGWCLLAGSAAAFWLAWVAAHVSTMD